MKDLITPVLIAAMLMMLQHANAQTGTSSSPREIVIPTETSIVMELTETITVPDTRKGTSPNKIGDKVGVIVREDVIINGVVVVKKGTVAKASIRDLVPLLYNFKGSRSPNNEGQITIDITEVPAVDGTSIKLVDCYIQVYAVSVPAHSIKVGKVSEKVVVRI
jgi:hypothetical protein